MCNAFGMAADERSWAATECELARNQFLSRAFASHIVFGQQFKSSPFVFESDNGITRRAAEASNCWIVISA
jgi:hypothetical protein